MISAVSFIRVVQLLCVAYRTCHSQQLISCDGQISSLHIVTIKETDPPGTNLNFSVRTISPGDYWRLELKSRISPQTLRDTFLSSFEFRPVNTSNRLYCGHTPNTDSNYCNLILVKKWDVERVKKIFKKTLPIGGVEFDVVCKSQYSQGLEQRTDLIIKIKTVNEYPPTFREPRVTVIFTMEDLVEGKQIFTMYSQASDKDAGLDGQIVYGIVSGRDLITLEGTRVVLKRNLTEKDFVGGLLRFVMSARDLGTPSRSANMTLIVRLLTEGEDDVRNTTDTTSDTTGGGGGNNTPQVSDHSATTLKIALIVLIPLFVVALMACLMKDISKRMRKSREKKQAQHGKQSRVVIQTTGKSLKNLAEDASSTDVSHLAAEQSSETTESATATSVVSSSVDNTATEGASSEVEKPSPDKQQNQTVMFHPSTIGTTSVTIPETPKTPAPVVEKVVPHTQHNQSVMFHPATIGTTSVTIPEAPKKKPT